MKDKCLSPQGVTRVSWMNAEGAGHFDGNLSGDAGIVAEGLLPVVGDISVLTPDLVTVLTEAGHEKGFDVGWWRGEGAPSEFFPVVTEDYDPDAVY